MSSLENNIIVYVSSRNNYDMLEGEVLKNIDLENFEFINVDDKSCEEEILKGKKICEANGIKFLHNKSRGVQMATQTLVDWTKEHRPKCKWIVCFQHDHYPLTKNFFTRLSEITKSDKLKKVGILGFNVLDDGDYTCNAYDQFLNGKRPVGMIGLAHLSIHDRCARWLCPKQQSELLKLEQWRKPFIVEFPMWACIALNVDIWDKYVTPTTEYQFHLWLPDVAMQLNFQNIPSLILPSLYTFNDQKSKLKYNINNCSAAGARQGNEYHFGQYSNFSAWISRWGWHYEDPKSLFPLVQDRYKNSLIGEYFSHDIKKGPLRNISL